ncbi:MULTISPECIES: antibiotic biosynthesis monooxygenase family protein [unclassified Nonomuraea]|uniref:antibiotic biosynthesis monooxygenase family protein n=1 Tax=Nonomuraea sp. NPDC003804 TaxID=3154547 RepID=UPI0033BCA50C
MIARIWHGATPIEKSADYLRLMREVAIPDYRSTPGCRGAYVLRREEGDVAHFITLTFWDSEESVAAFAGDDVTVAKYYDFDADYLLEQEPRVTHHDLYDR